MNVVLYLFKLLNTDRVKSSKPADTNPAAQIPAVSSPYLIATFTHAPRHQAGDAPLARRRLGTRCL